MLWLAFSVFDDKSELYTGPMLYAAAGIAVREFSDAVNDKSTKFGAHPGDYKLVKVGEYDDSQGRMIPCDGIPEVVASGSSLVVMEGAYGLVKEAQVEPDGDALKRIPAGMRVRR